MSSATARVSAHESLLPRSASISDWCSWTENSEKISAVVGRTSECAGARKRLPMAANAVLRGIRQNDIDPTRVGFLGLGTESSTDNAAGAVIVRGMVDRALESWPAAAVSAPRGAGVQARVLGGIYASRARCATSRATAPISWPSSSARTWGVRGGAAANRRRAPRVACWSSVRPSCSSRSRARGQRVGLRGPTPQAVRAPFHRGYAPKTQRLSDFRFSGKYSTFSYLDETVHAVERMLSRMQVSAGSYYGSVRGLFFHRPYHLMPVQAMSFLYVRGLARGDHHHDELRALCQEAGASFDAVITETASTPDLYGELLKDDAVADPYAATSAVAGLLRKQRGFRQLLDEKMGLGVEAVNDLGNLYSAALPAWIAAGFEEAARQKLPLADAPMVAVGYGSGDAAEALPLYVSSGFEAAASRIGFLRSLEGGVTLTREQYEALHDGTDVPSSLTYTPKEEFAIARVGKQYGASFQDLGVEYYDFVH